MKNLIEILLMLCFVVLVLIMSVLILLASFFGWIFLIPIIIPATLILGIVLYLTTDKDDND